MLKRLWNWLFPKKVEEDYAHIYRDMTYEEKMQEKAMYLTPAEWAEDWDRRHSEHIWLVEHNKNG